MNRFGLTFLCLLGALVTPRIASATKSAELYTSAGYPYGRFEARMRVTAGDGIVSAFFLWKDGSEKAGTFWNELDYEKIGASCELQTNALYGNPSVNHTQKPTVSADLCADFHVYTYEWTADYIAWSLDGTEVRRETGATATAYAQNTPTGMQVHFNVWPGDSSFGGNFNPSILPVHQYIDWVQFSSYADGMFTLAWREDFTGSTAPTGWLTGDWGSPKNLSTHDPRNVNFLGGYAVLSMTADDATGPAGAMSGPDGMGGMAGTSGQGGTAAGASAGGGAGTGGTADPGGSGGQSAAGGTSTGGTAGGPGATGGAGGTAATTGGTGGSGATGAGGGAGGGTGAVGGGSSGAANSGGTAGVLAGNSGASGTTSSVAGTSTGGNPGTGGAEATAGEPSGDGTKSGDKAGCGCRVPGSSRSSQPGPGTGAALLLALVAAFRRRRVSRVLG